MERERKDGWRGGSLVVKEMEVVLGCLWSGKEARSGMVE